MSQGDTYDHKSLVKAIEKVDVVISAVSSQQIADQVNIVAAIKEAGGVKVHNQYSQLILLHKLTNQ